MGIYTRRNQSSQGGCLTMAIIGVVFLGVTGVLTFFLGQTVSLDCQRVEPTVVNCVATNTLFGRFHVGTREFNNVSSAMVDESCDEDGCTYRVSLRTGRGVLPVSDVYSSGPTPKYDAADQINSYLASGERDLFIEQIEDLGWVWFMVACFGGVGLLMLLSAPLQLLRGRLF